MNNKILEDEACYLHPAKIEDMRAAVLVKVPAVEFSGHWNNG